MEIAFLEVGKVSAIVAQRRRLAGIARVGSACEFATKRSAIRCSLSTRARTRSRYILEPPYGHYPVRQSLAAVRLRRGAVVGKEANRAEFAPTSQVKRDEP
jgi:hypothetical protein